MCEGASERMEAGSSVSELLSSSWSEVDGVSAGGTLSSSSTSGSSLILAAAEEPGNRRWASAAEVSSSSIISCSASSSAVSTDDVESGGELGNCNKQHTTGSSLTVNFHN